MRLEISKIQSNNFFYIQSFVSAPAQFVDKTRMVPVLALIDTGASRSTLSSDVVRDLGLVPLGKKIVGTAGGDVASYLYPCSFHLRVNPELLPPEAGKTEPRIRYWHFPIDLSVLGNDSLDKSECAAIIGMDIIRHLHVTIVNGELTTITNF